MLDVLRAIVHQPYAFTTALAGVMAAAMAVFVLWKNPQMPSARYWALMSSCIALWACLNVISLLSDAPADSLKYLRWADAAALFIPVTFLHFAMHFSSRRHPHLLKASYLVTGLLLLTAGTPWFVAEGQRKFGIYFEVGGPAFAAFAVLFVLLPTLGVAYILQAAVESAGKRRSQLLCVALACAIGFGGGFMWFLPVFNIDIPPVGAHIILFYGVIAMYAILRYQFLDIRIIIRRSVVYSLLVTLLTVGYFGLIYILERFFQTQVGYQSLGISVAAFASTALLFQPMKQWLQGLVDRWLMPERKDALIRRLEALEREVRESDKARAVGQLAAGIAHEIKNPLTAIKTFVDYFPEKQDDPEFRQQFYRVVKDEVIHLRDLSQGLLDFSKPTAHCCQAVNLGAVLERSLSLVKAELDRTHVQIRTDYRHNGAVLQGNPDQLAQVFVNLILNAKDAMQGGGQLSISTRNNEQGIEIVFSDTGCGIQPRDLPHIFDPFFSKKSNGNGLGLSIVQNIIKSHGGSIEVTSQLNHGTTFSLKLPVQVKS